MIGVTKLKTRKIQHTTLQVIKEINLIEIRILIKNLFFAVSIYNFRILHNHEIRFKKKEV